MSELTCPNCGHSMQLPPSEPPVGTWVKDRFGGTSQRTETGWGTPGCWPVGDWAAMWAARGPLVECGTWGSELDA